MNTVLQSAQEALAIAQGATDEEDGIPWQEVLIPAEEILDMSPAAMLRRAR